MPSVIRLWGAVKPDKGNDLAKYALPISFTSLFMTGCCANKGAYYADTVSFSADLTTITISTENGNVATGYILIGK